MCVPRGGKIPPSSELLFRQVRKAWMDGDQPSEQAFLLSSFDDGCLSVDWSKHVTAEQSWTQYNSTPRADGGVNTSEAVFAVSAEECYETNLLSVHHDPPPVSHSVIEMAGISKKDERIERKRLLACAKAHGCRFRRPS